MVSGPRVYEEQASTGSRSFSLPSSFREQFLQRCNEQSSPSILTRCTIFYPLIFYLHGLQNFMIRFLPNYKWKAQCINTLVQKLRCLPCWRPTAVQALVSLVGRSMELMPGHQARTPQTELVMLFLVFSITAGKQFAYFLPLSIIESLIQSLFQNINQCVFVCVCVARDQTQITISFLSLMLY